MGNYMSVRIWEPLQQRARISRYEIPLANALRSHHLGEVHGISSQMSMELEVESFEFELNVLDLDLAVDLITVILEQAGAPVGSEIRFERDGGSEIVRIGKTEGLAIYLDGINLPDAVYDSCTCDALAALMVNELNSVDGEIRGSWVGRNETAIYIYGPNAETMFTAIEPILAAYPLCQNARVVIRNGSPSLNPRTVRFPLHRTKEPPKHIFWSRQHGSV